MPIAGKVLTPSGFPAFASVGDNVGKMGLNILIFGPPGVGKTTFAGNIAKLQPNEVLLFDTDIGRESVLDLPLHVAEPPKLLAARAAGEDEEGISKKLTWSELRAYLDTALAMRDKSPYKTYIFDSLSSIYYELLVPKVTNREGKDPVKMEWPHYAEAQALLTKFIRDAKSLSEYGINTVFLGHERGEQDGEITNVFLSLPQGIRNEILLTVNHVGYLQRKKNSEDRELHLAPPRRVSGPKVRKTQSGPNIPTIIDNPSLDGLVKMLART